MNSKESRVLYETLLEECANNKVYFEKLKDDKSQKLYAGFVRLEEQILNLQPLVNEVRQISPNYDYKNVPANGYRSFIVAVDQFCSVCLKICKNVRNRTSLFFHKAHYAKEVEYCVQLFMSLNACFQLLHLQKTFTHPQSLFLEDTDKIDIIEQLINKMDVKSFYGRFIGFQYGESMQPVVKTVAIMMAAFSQYYFHEKNMIQCAAIGSQYYANPDLRAERLEQITNYRKTTVYFCKSFWSMSEHEIARKMNVFFQPTRSVNEKFELPNDEPLEYRSEDGRLVSIPVPKAHIGNSSLRVRLLSSVKRKGMEYFKRIQDKKGSIKPASDWLILHCHGGGFISQTSESHQLYLKDWSRWTDGTPILSVDYSLAPEAPYPRALEEILYAYVWALNNSERLGTTAQRIVVAGDSAGGNLCVSLALKCIELNIRKPDGVFSAYAPTVLQFYPSPSRFLGFMDPLLSFGFMMCSIKAYIHQKNRLNGSSILFENDYEKRSPSSTENSIEDDYAEKESISSAGSDIFDATDNSSPSSFLEYSNEYEQNSVLPDTSKDAPVTEEMNLPSKYKNIIKGFMSNLKEKFHVSESKIEDFEFEQPPDFANVESISQLVREAEDSIFLSVAKADDKYLAQFPTTSILTVEMDPCLDDSIVWAKRLDKLKRTVHLDVLPNMAHGFLNVALSSKEAYHGSMFCAQRIKELLSGESPKEFHKLK